MEPKLGYFAGLGMSTSLKLLISYHAVAPLLDIKISVDFFKKKKPCWTNVWQFNSRTHWLGCKSWSSDFYVICLCMYTFCRIAYSLHFWIYEGFLAAHFILGQGISLGLKRIQCLEYHSKCNGRSELTAAPTKLQFQRQGKAQGTSNKGN